MRIDQASAYLQHRTRSRRHPMLYFILWCVFLLVVLLAVPVVNFLEKKRHKANSPEPTVGDAWEDEGPDAEGFGDADAAFGDPGEGEPVAADLGGDDLAAFDEASK